MEDILKFQYIRNYKAYRRIMITTRVIIIVVLAGAAASAALLHIALGILLPLIVAFIGAITIVASLHKEETYMVFEDRVVIKSGQKRTAFPIGNIKSVKYSRAFYEKDLATGTVKIRATATDKKSVKTYKLKHIFDAQPVLDFLTAAVKT